MNEPSRSAAVAGASPSGLSSDEVATRRRRDGENLLPQPDRRRWPSIVFGVLREPMLLLLLAAATLYLVLGDARDALLLGLSIGLVVALTLYQEVRSERALQALRDLSSPRARVLRDGRTLAIAARELVVDDVILVAEGDRIPADARIVRGDELQVDESLLTGESVPVRRGVAQADTEADAHLLAGTLVVRGNATAVVTAIGAHTEMGRIGASLQGLHGEHTPLQREMRRVVLLFALLSFASCVLVAGLYVALRGGWLQGLLAGITLAMANIPEEFPVVLTVFLALGAWRMARQRVLVRRPAAIEALGAVSVLCTDKTGTLTENRISLVELVVPAQAPGAAAAVDSADAQALLACARRASAAHTQDPIDRAVLGFDAAPTAADADDAAIRVREYGLAAELPVYTSVWRLPGTSDLHVACKGAPEAVAGLCALTPVAREQVLAAVTAMAQRGLRVLGVAEASWSDDARQLPGRIDAFAFQWRGLLGLADPLRTQVPAAMAEARAAGIRVVMLTGDHIETARAIATAAGLSERASIALGAEIDALDDVALADISARVDVFARVRPEHKLRLVTALKQRGAVVAMTGDGVNDAPALMAAHVGVAMGERGTDVAREASSIVLLDDDFASIVRAVRMGRAIYDNIRRAVNYIIAVHVPITGLAVLPLLLDAPLILLPLHVVFLELIIDPACSIMLEREPEAADIMRRPPRAANARLINAATLLRSLARGAVALLAVVLVYLHARESGYQPTQQAALAFAALVAGNVGLIVLHRAGASFWQALRRPNLIFHSVLALTSVALVAITQWSGPASWFGFAPVPPAALALAVAVPLLTLVVADMMSRRTAPSTA